MKYLNIATSFKEKFINEIQHANYYPNSDLSFYFDPRRNLDKYNLENKNNAAFISSDLVDKSIKGAIFILVSTLSIGLILCTCYGLKKYIESQNQLNLQQGRMIFNVIAINDNNLQDSYPSITTSSPRLLNGDNLFHQRE